jgi:hypothetical protein
MALVSSSTYLPIASSSTTTGFAVILSSRQAWNATHSILVKPV